MVILYFRTKLDNMALMDGENRITLNVGGIRFETYKVNITRKYMQIANNLRKAEKINCRINIMSELPICPATICIICEAQRTVCSRPRMIGKLRPTDISLLPRMAF